MTTAALTWMHRWFEPRDDAVRAAAAARPLARGRSLALARPQGRLVRCDRGCIWLTHDGDPRDIVLAAGEAHRCDRDAPLIVHALDDARVYVEPPPGRGGRRDATCP